MNNFFTKKDNKTNIKFIESKNNIYNYPFIAKSKKHNNKVMDWLWKINIGKLIGENKFPFMFMSYRFINGQWIWFCEREYQKVNICSNNPLDFFFLELESLINLVKLSNRKISIIPIHLNLSFFENNKEIIHANTIILDFNKKDIYIFEPNGVHNNLIPNFTFFFSRDWKIISKKISWNFKGYFLPNLNYQIYDRTYCYLWTSWIENILLLNYNKKIDNIRNYFKNSYYKKKLLLNIYKMDDYLLNIFNTLS